MARNKRGLGQVAQTGQPEDLLETVFGTNPDTPRPPAAEKKVERVAKYFQLDRELVKAAKVYAAQHEMREVEVMEAALRSFLGKSDQ